MYVCMYVCVYVYMYVCVCMYVYMHVCVCVCVCVYVCVCVCVCMYVCMYVCIMYVCTCVCLCVYVCIYVCVYVCVCMYICMCVCVFMYVYPHTHTHKGVHIFQKTRSQLKIPSVRMVTRTQSHNKHPQVFGAIAKFGACKLCSYVDHVVLQYPAPFHLDSNSFLSTQISNFMSFHVGSTQNEVGNLRQQPKGRAQT